MACLHALIFIKTMAWATSYPAQSELCIYFKAGMYDCSHVMRMLSGISVYPLSRSGSQLASKNGFPYTLPVMNHQYSIFKSLFSINPL
jgi:hypothetical protein